MRDNIHIIRSAISSFNDTKLEIKANENRLGQNVAIMQNALETTKNLEINKL